MKLFLNFCIFLCAIVLFSCEDDPISIPIDPTFETKAGRDIVVINEGAFGASNAVISLINTEEDTLSNNIFQEINNQGIGDVLQSAVQIDDEIWMVVNGTPSVLIMDTKTLELKEKILLDGSPRFITEELGTVFISDFGAKMHMIDVETKELSEIPTPGWTEEIISADGFILATCPRDFSVYGNYVYKFEANTGSLVDSVELSYNPISIVQHGPHAYVICSGDYEMDKGGIYKIDRETMKVLASSSFNDEVPANYSMKIRNLGGQVIFMSGQIYEYTDNSTLSADQAIFSDIVSAYGLDVNNESQEVYVLDAVDYTSRGSLKIFSQVNDVLKEFKVGINPNGVLVLK